MTFRLQLVAVGDSGQEEPIMWHPESRLIWFWSKFGAAEFDTFASFDS
jgi:hypothetical protein